MHYKSKINQLYVYPVKIVLRYLKIKTNSFIYFMQFYEMDIDDYLPTSEGMPSAKKRLLVSFPTPRGQKNKNY